MPGAPEAGKGRRRRRLQRAPTRAGDQKSPISCIAFIGKQNQPLSVRCYGIDDELAMQFAMYSAVDIIEEKISQQLAGQPATAGQPGVPPQQEAYLGYLCPAVSLSSEQRIHGYAGPTGVKILVALSAEEREVADNEMRVFFKALHKTYADALCNPFVTESIESKRFLATVDRQQKLLASPLQ